ncbi:MAG TPA: glycosyltransferase family 2 protein [Alphaproteobacteria bacterium]|nr:glycosyltransferase family 2 protein [Alphaproteobacteria bacterium]
MLVSICIPTCDRPLLLWEAILSCFAQSHRPLEVLIGDDSANDDSKSLVETIVSPQGVTLRYRRNRPRLGQAGNVNSLFDAACGDWIILLHDDDTLLPGAVGLLLDRFNSDPEIVAAYGKQWLMSFDGAVLEQESESLNRFYFRDPGHAGTRLSALEAALVQQFPNDGYMVRSSAARALRYPEEGETDRVSWCDFAFGLRLAQHGPFHFLNAFTASTGSPQARSAHKAAPGLEHST